MSKFVVPIWTARVPDVRRDLHAAAIAVVPEPSGRWGELKAIVEASSAEDAVTRVRVVVGDNAAVPEAAWPSAE